MHKSADPNSRFQMRRRARMERWNRPLETRWDRLRAWSNMLFVDHGLIRYVYPNRHRVTDRLWRSAQPAPHHLHAFARAGGKSVVSLRGGMFFGSLPLEREACERAGLAFHTFVLRSRTLPSRDDLITAKRLFDRLDYPALIHCKSGADRVGFMSALYLVFAEGRPVSEARRQLSLRYGHIRQGKTGVLDAFFEAYERETGGAVPLIDWIETGYDRARVIAGHRPSPWGTLLTDLVLRRE